MVRLNEKILKKVREKTKEDEQLQSFILESLRLESNHDVGYEAEYNKMLEAMRKDDE